MKNFDNLLSMKVGIGQDIHRTKATGDLILGGVLIPALFGLSGHSDADVLTHAVIDALLGALGEGDIGEWFSDQDEKNRNRCSMEMLKEVMHKMVASDYIIVNLDVIVIAEKPKLSSHKLAIKHSLAKALNVDSSQVNIKAKTYEKIGDLGHGKAVEVRTIVLIKRRPSNE